MLLSNVALPRELLFHGTLPTDLPFHNWTRGSPKSYDLRCFHSQITYGGFQRTNGEKNYLSRISMSVPMRIQNDTHTHMKIRSRQRESKYSTNGYYLALGAAKELYVYSLAFPLEYIQRCWAWMVDQSCAIAKWQVSRMIRWPFSSQYSVP